MSSLIWASVLSGCVQLQCVLSCLNIHRWRIAISMLLHARWGNTRHTLSVGRDRLCVQPRPAQVFVCSPVQRRNLSLGFSILLRASIGSSIPLGDVCIAELVLRPLPTILIHRPRAFKDLSTVLVPHLNTQFGNPPWCYRCSLGWIGCRLLLSFLWLLMLALPPSGARWCPSFVPAELLQCVVLCVGLCALLLMPQIVWEALGLSVVSANWLLADL